MPVELTFGQNRFKAHCFTHYFLKMSENEKLPSTFHLQLQSSAIVVSVLLRLFAFVLGFFMAILIDGLIFGGMPAFFVPVLICTCLFGTNFCAEQLLVTDCEVIATEQGLWVNIAKPVLIFPRSNFLVEWEDIVDFKSGNVRYGKSGNHTQSILSISRTKGYKLRFRGDEAFSLASYLRKYLPEKERLLGWVWV